MRLRANTRHAAKAPWDGSIKRPLSGVGPMSAPGTRPPRPGHPKARGGSGMTRKKRRLGDVLVQQVVAQLLAVLGQVDQPCLGGVFARVGDLAQADGRAREIGLQLFADDVFAA